MVSSSYQDKIIFVKNNSRLTIHYSLNFKRKTMIDFKSTLKMAVVSLKINKMRSMLTSLGIIIGVSAVIIMLAVGTGASEKVQKDMESMGSNILTIRSASAKSGGVRMGMGTRPTLTLKDAAAIEKMLVEFQRFPLLVQRANN